MCGIAGIWNIGGRQVSPVQLSAFTDSLSHRGPDGYGYELFDNGKLGFGHRRLSILDLSETGKQPMSYAGGRYWITYNGEVYNFIELRKELESSGYSFKSESDTEVILASYDKWGSNCLYKFNGMWSFAIWDNVKKLIFIARDRWGVKPLYYTHRKDELFAFASETYSFGFLEGFTREIDADKLSHALYSFNTFEASGHTIYKDIYQLPPGHFMLISLDGEPIQKRWWNTADHLQEVPESFDKQVEVFFHLFEDSCKLRLRSDVPLASALSGGIDSSSVYCLLQYIAEKGEAGSRIPADWHKAFAATFPGAENDERIYAEEVMRYTSGDITYVEQDRSRLAEQIVDTTLRFDAISGTPVLCLTDVYKAMRKQGISVSLDGHGADEMMFGYTSGVAEAYVYAFANGKQESSDYLKIYQEMLAPSLQESYTHRLKQRVENALPVYRESWKSGIKTKLKKTLGIHQYYSRLPGFTANGWFRNHSYTELPFREDQPYEFLGMPPAQAELWRQFHYTDLPYNLRDFDRGSMQNGVEIRMPFMDWRLVTFLFSLPLESRLGNGFTKRILREAMKGKMPESIRTRKLKTGLTSPLAQWFNGPLAEFLKDTCSSSHFQDQPFWNGALIADIVKEKCNLKKWDEMTAQQLWLILNASILIHGK